MSKQHFEEVNLITPTIIKRAIPHSLVVGKSGSGKTTVCQFILTQKVGKEKCIDIYDDKWENLNYSIPETKEYIINKLNHLSNKTITPLTLDNDIYFIAGSNLKYLKELPNNAKIISINEDDLTMQDFYDLLASDSESAKAGLAIISSIYGEELKLKDIEQILKDNPKELNDLHALSKSLLLRNISRWRKSLMFSDKFERLNLIKILEDNTKITSFSTVLLDTDSEKGLWISFILKKILDIQRRHLIKHQINIYFREVHNILGRYADRHLKSCSTHLLKLIREGRYLRTNLIMDTQRAGDLPVPIRRQIGTSIFLKIDYADTQSIKDIVGWINEKILYKLIRLKVGQGFVLDSDGNYFYPCFFLPLPFHNTKPGDNLIKLLVKQHGSYKLDSNTKQSQIYESSLNALDNKSNSEIKNSAKNKGVCNSGEIEEWSI